MDVSLLFPQEDDDGLRCFSRLSISHQQSKWWDAGGGNTIASLASVCKRKVRSRANLQTRGGVVTSVDALSYLSRSAEVRAQSPGKTPGGQASP
ncbi:Protein of unknown function [Gryllus bimaculatus]|nr:Protein of unknown function [Gryllus bimaculatus]